MDKKHRFDVGAKAIVLAKQLAQREGENLIGFLYREDLPTITIQSDYKFFHTDVDTPNLWE